MNKDRNPKDLDAARTRYGFQMLPAANDVRCALARRSKPHRPLDAERLTTTEIETRQLDATGLSANG